MIAVDVQASVIAAALGVIIHVVLALLLLFSSVANLLVIIIFFRRPALRTLSNRFVVSLLVFNLVATGVLLPLVLIDSVLDMSVADTVGWYQVQLEHNICIVGQALTTLVTTGSISAALVIAVDQYCAVMTPLHYHRRITKTRAWLLLAAQWLLAVAMATFSFVDSSGKQFWKGCTSVVSHVAAPVTDDDLSLEMADTDTDTNSTMLNNNNGTSIDYINYSSNSDQVWTLVFVTMSVVCYVVPVALLTWMYLRIYSAAHRNSQRTRRASLTHSASELVVHCLGSSQTISGSVLQVNGSSFANTNGSSLFASATSHSWCGNGGSFGVRDPPSRTPSLRSTSSQIVNSLRYRISNASLFLYREESRAARVSVLVLVLVVFCWLPYHVMLVVHALPERRVGRLPSYAYYLSLVAILLNSLLSPFLYAYRSRRIQREVRRLFGMAPKSRRYDAVSNASNAVAAAAAAKSLMKPASPRRQLMRKHVRDSDILSPDEVQSVLNTKMSMASLASMSSSPSTGVRSLMQKVTRLWRKPAPLRATAAAAAAVSVVIDDCQPPAAPGDAQLTPIAPDASRSSFSSGTSSNNFCSADSDVSL